MDSGELSKLVLRGKCTGSIIFETLRRDASRCYCCREMTRDDEKDLTPQEVATRLRLSIDSIYRHLKSGRLRSYRIGGPSGEYRIPLEALEAFMWTPEATESE